MIAMIEKRHRLATPCIPTLRAAMKSSYGLSEKINRTKECA
jgi:hypothetical protein